MKTEALNDALSALSQQDQAASSARLLGLQDDLDLPGAEAAIGEREADRGGLLLRGTDAQIAEAESAILAAIRDRDRRRAASLALQPLIEAAREREAKEAIEHLAKSARATRLRALQAYVQLDQIAVGIVDLLADIRREEAFLADANRQLREAGRARDQVGLPMMELARLAGCDGQFLPLLDRWMLHGYTAGPTAALGDAEARPIIPSRRFGRLAELLPGATPSSREAAELPVSRGSVDRAFVPQV